MSCLAIPAPREDTTADRKTRLLDGLARLFGRRSGRNPAAAPAAIDAIDFAIWGIGGLSVLDYRAAQTAKEPPR